MILIVFILSMLPILEMLLILSIIRYLTLFKSIFIGIRTFFFLNFSAIPTWQFLRCGQIVWTLTCLVLLFLLNEISMPEKSLRSTTLLPKLVSLNFVWLFAYNLNTNLKIIHHNFCSQKIRMEKLLLQQYRKKLQWKTNVVAELPIAVKSCFPCQKVKWLLHFVR